MALKLYTASSVVLLSRALGATAQMDPPDMANGTVPDFANDTDTDLDTTTWPYFEFNTVDFEPPVLEMNQTGEVDPGYIFFGPYGVQEASEAPLIYDNEGNLVYQGDLGTTKNFRVQQLNGEDVLTYWQGDLVSGYGYGSVHILDSSYQEIYTITLNENYVTTDSYDSFADFHESHVTDRGTLLVTAYNRTEADLTSVGGNGTGYILDCVLNEIDIATNELVFSWSMLEHSDSIPISASHVDLGEDGTEDSPYDPWHMNSITAVEGGYIISVRHTWSAYFISTDGSVVWQLSGEDGGDFEQIGSGATNFSYQHDIRIFNETEEGMVLNFFNNDNHNDETVGPTTGLSLQLDFTKMTVTGLRELIDPEDIMYAESQGSYQLLSDETDHVFMGYGAEPVMKEYDADGNVVFSAAFAEDANSYRIYKFQWSATPYWKPEVNATTTDCGATVYMSWNGATDFDNWVVYSAASSNSTNNTKAIGYTDRTGFESSVNVTYLPTSYLQVAARKGQVVLATSDIFSL